MAEVPLVHWEGKTLISYVVSRKLITSCFQFRFFIGLSSIYVVKSLVFSLSGKILLFCEYIFFHFCDALQSSFC